MIFRALAVILSFGVLACGENSAPQDGGASDDGSIDQRQLDSARVSEGGVAHDAGDDVGPRAFCEMAGEGAECGERQLCREGLCTFTDSDAPCDIDFTTVPAGAFLVISCDHDLAGADIVMAPGVTFFYNGGSIGNGKIRLNGGRIDGRLLNIELELAIRTNPGTLLNPRFVFDKERWQIQEGPVTDGVAMLNREHINAAIKQVSALAGETFVIGALDVFLEIHTGHNTVRAIRIPSDFHLQMSDDTHLRVQANTDWEYSLLLVIQERNVRISGGHLWGDRFIHNYAGGDPRHDSQDQGIGIQILGVENIVVENVTANQFIGDGLLVGASSRRQDDGTPQPDRIYSADVVIRGCVFDENRRNGLAITDADGVIIEDVTISHTGLGDQETDGPSAGVWPKQGIDLESTQALNSEGVLRLLEIVQNVVIRNSRFFENYGGDIDLAICHDVEVYGNTLGGSIGMVSAYDISVHDNVLVRDGDSPRGINIRGDGSARRLCHDWEVYNNRIRGYPTGLIVGGRNQSVHDNTIEDFSERAIYLLSGSNNVFENNDLQSTQVGSRGYANFRNLHVTGRISGGVVSVEEDPLHFNVVNGQVDGEGRLIVSDVDFRSLRGGPVSVAGSNNITIERCTADDYSERDNTDVRFENNTTR